MTVVDPASALRERHLRVTPQRRAILGAFEGRQDEHLAAEDVLSRAASVVPEVSRGTVYATLAELTELGLLAAVGATEPVRYETNVRPHDHFRCQLCARLFDVELDEPDLSRLAAAGFSVRGTTVIADGVCAECGAYADGLRRGAAAVRSTPQLAADQVGGLAVRRQDSPVGPLLLAASADGLVRLAFEDHADVDALAAQATTRRGGRDARDRLKRAGDTLDAYFGGEHAASTDVVDWSGMAVPGREALEATRRIAFGTSRSYEDVCSGASAADCGYAMGVNPMPLLLPCHRVTRGATRVDDYVGGLARRDRLDALERATG